MKTALARRNAWMRQLKRLQQIEHEPEGRFRNVDRGIETGLASPHRVHCASKHRRRFMSSASGAVKPAAPPLPTKLEEWQRKLKAERTLNDLVEDIHRMLCEDEDYLSLLKAIYDEQAVEGSLGADNVMASQMIRNRAKKIDGNELANEKLATISKALGVVLRRYGASRKERRQTVHGEIVPDTNHAE
jgi:hypothetical protein